VTVPIRPATAEDLEEIVLLEREVPEAPHWSRAEYEGMVGRSGTGVRRCLLVAKVDGTLAGFAVAKVVNAAVPAELESVVVRGSTRRTGLGAGLCRAIIEWCRSEGAESIELDVRLANRAARALYLRLGFVEEGVRRGYYRDPDDDALLMQLKLAACG
jgi:ribosomal-protein-alanine N-acetyltransferase